MEDNYEYEKKTILIVDDEQKIVDLLVHNLKREGYNTIEANDGQTAVDIAIDKRPDLILLDVMLPRMDGLSVCKKIKNVYNVPILMISAKDDELDKIVGLELGADDYITKPFSVREVVARVKANLRKVEATMEAQAAAQKNNEKQDKKKERRNPDIIKASRKTRIASGSGTSVQEVNKLLQQFDQMKKMMKMISNGNMKLPF